MSSQPACPLRQLSVRYVRIYVDYRQPLAQIQAALLWEAITKVMTRRWREGENGVSWTWQRWDITLDVPGVGLLLIKKLRSCEVEASIGILKSQNMASTAE